MKTRNSLYLIVLFVSCLWIADMCLAKDVVKDGPCVEKIFYTIEETQNKQEEKTVPLYKFKKDVTGRFLERFLDSLGEFKCFNIIKLDEVEHIGFPHAGSIDEYIFAECCNLNFSGQLESTNAAIELPSHEYIILPNINDTIVNLLHVEHYGDVLFRIDVPKKGFVPDYPLFAPPEALLHIMGNGKVDLVYLYYPFEYDFDEEGHVFDWIPQFYKDNSFSPKITCEYMPEAFEVLGLLNDSIPKKLIIGEKSAGKFKDVVEIKHDDIMKLKHDSPSSFKYRLTFPPMSEDALKKRIEYIKSYFSNGDKHPR